MPYMKVKMPDGSVRLRVVKDINDIESLSNNSNLEDMTGTEFENLIEKLLIKMGLEVETTKVSGDGGIDLIARSKDTFFSGRYIVQCKRWSSSIGEPVIRDLYGAVTHERANKGILITNSNFTTSAINFAQVSRDTLK